MSESREIHWGGQVIKHLFSQQEVELLRSNPYVEVVTEESVQFTREFKKLFYQKKKEGVRIRAIFESFGIPPEILGERRISSFNCRLNQMAKLTNGFTDTEICESKAHSDVISNDNRRIGQLEARITYLEQVIEFIKKIQMADMGGQK